MYSCVAVHVWLCIVWLTQSKELKRFKDKLKEEEKLALKTAELQAPKDGKKQYMNGVKAQCNSRRLKRVSVNYRRGRGDLNQHTFLAFRSKNSHQSKLSHWTKSWREYSMNKKRRENYWSWDFWMHSRTWREVSLSTCMCWSRCAGGTNDPLKLTIEQATLAWRGKWSRGRSRRDTSS